MRWLAVTACIVGCVVLDVYARPGAGALLFVAGFIVMFGD